MYEHDSKLPRLCNQCATEVKIFWCTCFVQNSWDQAHFMFNWVLPEHCRGWRKTTTLFLNRGPVRAIFAERADYIHTCDETAVPIQFILVRINPMFSFFFSFFKQKKSSYNASHYYFTICNWTSSWWHFGRW